MEKATRIVWKRIAIYALIAHIFLLLTVLIGVWHHRGLDRMPTAIQYRDGMTVARYRSWGASTFTASRLSSEFERSESLRSFFRRGSTRIDSPGLDRVMMDDAIQSAIVVESGFPFRSFRGAIFIQMEPPIVALRLSGAIDLRSGDGQLMNPGVVFPLVPTWGYLANIVLFMGVAWAVDAATVSHVRARRQQSSRCVQCDYVLYGECARCPECGLAVPQMTRGGSASEGEHSDEQSSTGSK